MMGLALIAFVASLLAKPSGVGLPFVLMLLSVWAGKPIGRAGWVVWMLMLVLIWPVGRLAIVNQHRLGPILSFEQSLALSGNNFWFYMGKAVWPRDLLFMYPQAPVEQVGYAGLGILLGVFAVPVFLGIRRKKLTGGLLVVLVCNALLLAPTLGLVEALWNQFSWVADHWQYPAIACVVAGMAAGITRIMADQPTALRLGVPVVWVGMLAVLTMGWSAVFADERRLWQDTLAGNPQIGWVAYNRLGLIEHDGKNLGEAEEYYRKSLAVRPKFPDAWHNLGDVLADQGRLEEAVEAYQTAINNRSTPLTYKNMGSVLARLGRWPEAIRAYDTYLKVYSFDVQMRYLLAYAMVMGGDFDSAIAEFEKVIQIDPQYKDAAVRLEAVKKMAGAARTQKTNALQFNQSESK
jgi:hypothetical protein